MPELIPFTLLLLYLLPFLIAASRNHDMLATILIANVFLGWTIIGWCLLLVVSIMASSSSPTSRRRA